MAAFAETTTVPAERSQTEIGRIIARYGASGYMSGWRGRHAFVGFELNNRTIKFVLSMPDRNNRAFTHTPGRGHVRTTEAREKAYDQAIRQKWRALALVIKAKLEAVQSGIVEFDQEFMAHIVLPDGRTVSETLLDGIQGALETRSAPPMLPDYSNRG